MTYQTIESPFQLVDHSVEELTIKSKIKKLEHDDTHILKDISIIDASMFDEDDCYWGKLILSISVQCKNKTHARDSISVKIKISGLFSGKRSDDLSRLKFQKMLVANGTTTLYSIARAIISTTTSQCLSSGQVRLPMINILKLLDQINISFEIDNEESQQNSTE